MDASRVTVIVIKNQDSTSSRLLPGSSYSCCIRNLHALVHKQCHPVQITVCSLNLLLVSSGRGDSPESSVWPYPYL
jgi:hypothetical protein